MEKNSIYFRFNGIVPFIGVGPFQRTMPPHSAVTNLRLQEFLDSVSTLPLDHEEKDWYNVEVSAAIDGCSLLGHEVDAQSGSTLLFLKNSLMLCVPNKGHLAHYPRHLVHCFVDDFRRNGKSEEGLIMRAELFSISPSEEQLAWEIKCYSEHEVPSIQSSVSRWLRWLNE